LAFVAENSARATPLLYKMATAWAALEGSLVLWSAILAVYVLLVFRQFRRPGRALDGAPADDADRLGAGALAVLGAVAVFFFAVLVTVANPFRVLDAIPADGPGPNPLLQNHPLMAVHPPLLYLGYVGFSAPFAFAVSALALGERGVRWVRRTQRWTLVAWTFLTAGIVCGAWWSYEVLGWGGYWAWDPVENASLLPWLVGTAYLHSSVIQARRGLLQAWSVALVLATFALTIFGTFLTRSGVIASVHSFTQSGIGPVLLGFLAVVVVGSFGLFAWRAQLVAPPRRLDSLLSREGAFLCNNLLLTVLAFTVLVGTTYPILLEAFTGDQVSVGRPFFDRMAVPLAIALLAAMVLGPLLPYRAARAADIWRSIRLPLQVGLIATAVAVVAGLRSPAVALVLIFSVAVPTAALQLLAARRGAVLHAIRSDPGFWAGQVAHIGLAVLALGVATSSGLAHRTEVHVAAGGSVEVGPYTVAYDGPVEGTHRGRTSRGAALQLRRGDRHLAALEPRLTEFPSATQPVATPSVWTSRTGDEVFISLTSLTDDAASLIVWRRPYVFLVWGGGLLAAGGGALGLALRRRRTGVIATHAPPPREAAVVHP
jgi:cytochrome c-type biogenesis protein CcmF